MAKISIDQKWQLPNAHREEEQSQVPFHNHTLGTPKSALSTCISGHGTRQKQAPCPLQEERGWAAQARRKCHPAWTQRRRWYLAAGSVNHVPGKTYLAIPGPDSSTESPGEHRCCVHRRGGASPSFPKTMGLGGTFVSCTGLQRTAGPEPRRSQSHE